jgi:two-component system, cell cycle sensor histidine kinase and response regulator CckA
MVMSENRTDEHLKNRTASLDAREQQDGEHKKREFNHYDLLDFVPLGVFVLNQDYLVLFWNKCLESWTGISPGNICGRDIREQYARLGQPRYASRLKSIFGGGPPAIFSAQLHQYLIPAPLPNGEMRLQHTTVSAVKAPDGQSHYALFCLQDVTDVHHRIQNYIHMRDQAISELRDRMKAEEALRESEEKYRLLFSKERDAIILFDMGTRCFLDVNDAAVEFFGYSPEEFLNLTVADISADPAMVNEVIKKYAVDETTLVPITWHRRKDGTLFPMEISAGSFKWKGRQLICAIMRDVTERKRMEEVLLRAKKLEAMGILAGGIAHDFNNILTIILQNIDLAMHYAGGESSASRLLRNAIKAVLRASELTNQFITFSTGGTPVRQSVSLQTLIVDSATLALTGSNVACTCSFSDDLGLVEVDHGQMSQVIHNLVVNARDAVAEGGSISITAENIAADHRNQKICLLPEQGPYVKISVKDDGVGIPEEYRDKIFDPYFSTKTRGAQKGMGLGLTIAHSIITRHGGYIQVESEEGVGTTVEIYLAAVKQEVVPREHPEGKKAGVKGKVFLVDDEEMFREMVMEMLRDLGYEAVEMASDGAEAVEYFRAAKESDYPFDIVIMDLTLQGEMGGKELIKKLLEIDPCIKAIATSGYLNHPVLADFRDHGFRAALTKPFGMQQFADALQKVMEG